MTDPWLVALAVTSALFVSGLVLWRRLSRRKNPRPKPESVRFVQTSRPSTLSSAPVQQGRPPPEPEVLRQVVVLFGAESAFLTPPGRAALAEAARRLTDRPELTVTVEGSADSSGNASRNLILARDRAWAARQFLLDAGISGERIRSVVKPPAAGRTEYERRRLRCVRLTWEAT